MDLSDYPQDDLKVVAVEADDPANRSGSLAGDGYTVYLTCQRDLTTEERTHVDARLGGAHRITVSGPTIAIHDTTVEQIAANKVSIAQRIVQASSDARAEHEAKSEPSRQRDESMKAERKRRNDLAKGLKFD